jgi:hypothetical protein
MKWMIRSSYIALALLVAMLVAAPPSMVAASSWDDIAARFGCTQKLQQREQANGTQFIIEYLSADQTAGRPDRMFTITLSRVPHAEKAANEHAEKAIESIAQTAARAGAKIAEFSKSSSNHGPVAYFEYDLNGERNVGVICRTAPGILTVYQLATLREKSPTTEDRQRLRAMIGAK